MTITELTALLEQATKGPWTISSTSNPPLIFTSTRDGGSGAWIASIYADKPGDHNYHKANARLIALAPDLAAKVISFDRDFAALILAGNKILDAIDTYDSEKKPLPSNHPDVHAFSGLLDKMPVADTHAMAPDLAARVLELEAENARLREIIRVAKANIFNVQIGLESGTTKHAANEQLAKVRATLGAFEHD